MPTYEYRCNACHREFEYLQKMSDAELVKCEACGEDKLEKLISWTSVRGSSWKDALMSDNPRESLKGTTAVDKSKPPKASDAAPAVHAETVAAAAAAEAAAPVAPAAAATEVLLDPNDDDDDDSKT